MINKKDSYLKKLSETSKLNHLSSLSRRKFVLTSIGAVTGLTFIPQYLTGCTKDQPPMTYPPIQEIDDYSITVNGQEMTVYKAPIASDYNERFGQQWDSSYSFSSFEFSGQAQVEITSSKKLSALSIRPNFEGVDIRIDGNTATFTLEQPGNFLIERNNNGRKDPLMLFANPPMSDVPSLEDSNVIYYGPGHHNAGTINLISNQTLYIDKGAVVTGMVLARGVNIKILGHGLLEDSKAEGTDPKSQESINGIIQMSRCSRMKIEGIMIRKSSRGWTVVARDCDEVEISNVKICGSYALNDDGIDIVNSRKVIIQDCFIRTYDDCLAFKGMGYSNNSNCEDISVLRTVMWSDLHCAILIGDECRANFMRNITVKDCYIMYLSFEMSLPWTKEFLMIHAGEDIRIENLLFEDIVVYGQGQDRNYIEMSCEYNEYSLKKIPGHIRNVILRNIQLLGQNGPYTVEIKGFDNQYTVEDIIFDNCTRNGNLITSSSPNLLINNFTKNIQFISIE